MRKKRIFFLTVTALVLLSLALGRFHREILAFLPRPQRVQSAAQPQPDEAAREDALVSSLLSEMSTEEKVAQLFLVRCPRGDAAAVLEPYPVGGVVLFGENVAGHSRRSLRLMLREVQKAAATPLLIAVDEEGGSVNRLSIHSAFRDEPFPAPRTLYEQGGWLAIEADTAEKCRLLRRVGVNVNLAPVCDVCGDAQAYMYPRAFSGNASLTADYARRVVELYARQGVGCVLKHFPGYGSHLDTHRLASTDARTLAQLEECDLLPFAAGIEAGAQAVLLGHMVTQALDEQWPASLSKAVCGYLRKDMGFEGVIVTDDLSMAALGAYAGVEERAVLALLAGCDLLCTSSYASQYPALLAAVESGVVSPARLDEAAGRVLRWKLHLGLLG